MGCIVICSNVVAGLMLQNALPLLLCCAPQNFDRTFTHPTPKCGIAAKYPQLATHQKLAKSYDPIGMFSGSLVKQAFSGTGYNMGQKQMTGCR